MKKQRQLIRAKLPITLLGLILSGEEHTIDEWAEKFEVSKSQIGVALTQLRKRNYMLYPVGGKKGPGAKQGIIKNVVNSRRDYNETSERLTKQYANPHILATFRLLENYLIEDPSSYEEIEVQANELLMSVMQRKSLLLKEKNAKPYDGNYQHTNR